MAIRVATLLGITLAGAVGIGGVTAKVTQAVQLRDGTFHFNQPPDLVDATTTFDSVNVWGATYYFTINIPEKAGEPLQRLVIAQREGEITSVMTSKTAALLRELARTEERKWH